MFISFRVSLRKKFLEENQPTSQPTSQPANQPANQPTSQPANQPKKTAGKKNTSLENRLFGAMSPCGAPPPQEPGRRGSAVAVEDPKEPQAPFRVEVRERQVGVLTLLG